MIQIVFEIQYDLSFMTPGRFNLFLTAVSRSPCAKEFPAQGPRYILEILG